MKSFDLVEKRLGAFAVLALSVAEKLPPSFVGNHLGGQLTRYLISIAEFKLAAHHSQLFNHAEYLLF